MFSPNSHSNQTLPGGARIIIFGATGGTGAQVVRQALDAGYDVTAFARTPANVAIEHPRLRLAQGDVLDPAQVASAIAGHDAVVCALGAGPFSRERLRERGTRHIIQAMQSLGVQRLVALSGYGAAETFATLPFMLKRVVVPLYLSRVFQDHEAQERLVRQSGLQWTIVRPPTLTNGEARGEYECAPLLDKTTSKLKISRADVAQFMVAQLQSKAHVHASPAISY